jgi:NADPH-dependent ferric siderophore reductase
MLRLWFASPELADFESAAPDDHVKLFVPDAAGELVGRDFTPRLFDRAQRTLAIDFVLHEAGPATAWARAAQPGDTVLIGGPRGSNLIADDFDWYLLLGDETAIPAIARRIEELRPDVPIFAGIVVDNTGDVVPVPERPCCSVTWLPRRTDGDDRERLIDFVDSLALPAGEGYVWIAAEARTAQKLRAYIEDARGHPREWVKASGYWQRETDGGGQQVAS